MPEPVAQSLAPLRHHPLAGQQQGGAFAQQSAQQPGGRDGPGGPAHLVRQRRRERRVGHRLGRREVVDALRRGIGQQPDRQAGPIVQMDPAHPLPAVAETRPERAAERQQHPAQEPARRVQHQPRPDQADARPPGAGAAGRRLPLGAEAPQKIVRAFSLVGQHTVALVTVEPDRGSADQQGRRLARLRHARHQAPGERRPAALQQRFARGTPPAVENRRAGQVDDRIERVVRAPLLQSGQRPHHRAAQPRDLLGPSAQHGQGMPGSQQLGAEAPSEKPRSSREQNPHRTPP